MRRKFSFRTAILGMILVLFLLPFLGFAQENTQSNPEENERAVKFYVYPLKLEMPVAPGETLTGAITVLNQFPNPLSLKAYAMDYEIKKNSNFEFFPPGYQSYSCANWLTLSESEFTLAGNQEKKVLLTMKVPADAEPKGHYAVVFFESVGKPLDENTTGVITQGRIGTLVLQFTPGEEQISGKIQEFIVPKYIYSSPRFLFYGGSQSVPWEAVFKNTGNVHLNLEAQVEFLNYRGRSLNVTSPQRITLLPNTEREVKETWRDVPSFGKFSAVLKATYAGKTEYRTQVFYIIPVTGLVVSGLGILLLIIIGLLVRRRIKRLKVVNAELNYNLGLARLKEKNYQEAVKYLEKAVKLRKKHEDTLKALRKAYKGAGMKDRTEEIDRIISKLEKKD